MSDSISHLKIDNTQVLSSIVKLNPEMTFESWKNRDDTDGMGFSFTPTLMIGADDNQRAKLNIIASMFSENFIDNNEPFYASVEMAFYFHNDSVEMNDSHSNNIADQFAINMIAIALPFLRSHLTVSLSLSGIAGVLLPALNIQDMIEQFMVKEKS